MIKIVVQGVNGEMSIDDDKIKTKHTAPLFPGKREATLDIHSLQIVVYEKAYALINGFSKLVPRGNNPMLCQMVGLHQVGKDESAIVLRAFKSTNLKDVEHSYSYVVGHLDQIKAAENNQL